MIAEGVRASVEVDTATSSRKRCGCQLRCFIIWMVAIGCLITALVIMAIVMFTLDRNQCQRAINMDKCPPGDYECLLEPVDYSRHLARQKCFYDSKSVDRLLEKTNTIEYDKNDQQYCVLDVDLDIYETITSETVPNEFLHKGACGACSNAQDHEKYIETAETLTKYTTSAAALTVFSRKSGMQKMLSAGFTEECARCWIGNAENTIVQCFRPCVFGSRKSCGADGKLTKCLQCDEDHSGLFFRRCAGMTRRRAGIVSDICRQDGEIVDK